MGRDQVAGVTLRRAGARDQARVMALLDQLGYRLDETELAARMAGVSGAEGHLLLVAEGADGVVVGLVHAFERRAVEKPPEVTIQAMVVAEAHRSRGIGAALMRAVEDWALSRGFDVLGLHTQSKRVHARAFYERQGFEEVAHSVLYRRRLAR